MVSAGPILAIFKDINIRRERVFAKLWLKLININEWKQERRALHLTVISEGHMSSQWKWGLLETRLKHACRRDPSVMRFLGLNMRSRGFCRGISELKWSKKKRAKIWVSTRPVVKSIKVDWGSAVERTEYTGKLYSTLWIVFVFFSCVILIDVNAWTLFSVRN